MKKYLLILCMIFLSTESMAFEAGQLSLDTPNVLKKSEGSFGIRHRFTVNAGHDAYYQQNTLGFGVDINMKNNISWLTFTENMSLLAEYYPQIDEVDGVSGENDSYAFGIKFQTFAQHFELLVSNSTHMDARTMSLGTNNEELHFGFNINRKF